MRHVTIINTSVVTTEPWLSMGSLLLHSATYRLYPDKAVTGCVSAAYPGGRPRPRMAMMLRKIAEVPPWMV